MNIKPSIPVAAFYLCLSFFLLMACRKPDTAEQPVDTLPQVYDATQTKLGEKMGNPFSFKMVEKAIQLVKEKKRNGSISNHLVDPCDGGGGGNPPPITPTHTYVRFAPEDVDQLSALDESGLELFDVPLNYDIEEEGDWYQDPSLPADAITYQYTLVPYGYPLPAGIPVLVLDQLFLFNENAGEELEPDDWSGGGGGGNCGIVPYSTTTGQTANYMLPICEYVAQNGDPVINATQYLLNICLEPYEVYQTAAQLSGYEDNDNNGVTLLGNYTPAGRLQVFNTDINAPEPLKNVKVITRNFFKIDHGYTGTDGRFQMSKSYTKKASVKVKFANPSVTTRGINGVLKVWQYVFAVRHSIGRKQKNDLTNIDYTFYRDVNPHSENARKWVAAITMNAWFDSHEWNIQNGISTLPRVKIWLSSRLTSEANAPLLNYVLSRESGSPEAIVEVAVVNAIIDKLLIMVPYVGQALAILKKVIELNKPDITLRYGGGQTGNTLGSKEIYNTMLRQFSHASHYAGLHAQNKPSGPSIASDYWWQHTKYLITNSGYGAKTNAGAQRTAIIEAWGYFAGNTGNAFKYGNGVFAGNQIAQAIKLDEIRQLENSRRDDSRAIAIFYDGPGATSYYRGWIPCGLLHDFTDNVEDTFTGINDNVNGYSINGVFKGLRFTNNSVQEYRQQLLFQNGNLLANEVNNLVGQYGY